MRDRLFDTLVLYGFALVLALLAGGIAGIVLWAEKSRPSRIVLGAGGVVVAVMTLAGEILARLLPQ